MEQSIEVSREQAVALLAGGHFPNHRLVVFPDHIRVRPHHAVAAALGIDSPAAPAAAPARPTRPAVYSVAEVAQHAGLTVATIKRYARKGKLPEIDDDGNLPAPGVEAWLASRS